MNKDKETWEDFGEKNAYYAVATFDKFRTESLDQDLKHSFFETGREHVDEVWAELEGRYGVKLKPENALDYGCGVGRLTLPLAAKCERVTGVDISQAMLAETKNNADSLGLENVNLQNADEFLRDDESRYDFVHTFIVMQHIDPQIGMNIIKKMTERLLPGGFGMIHVTYDDNFPLATKLRYRLYRDVPGVHDLLNKLRGRTEKFMPMYEYDLKKVHELLEANGCIDRFTKPTDHSFLGEMIFFRKA